MTFFLKVHLYDKNLDFAPASVCRKMKIMHVEGGRVGDDGKPYKMTKEAGGTILHITRFRAVV